MKIALLVSLIILFQVSKAQTDRATTNKVSLAGRITDGRTGEALAGASVYLADDKIGTVTNNEGAFILNNIPPGHHILEISHLGYATYVEHLEILSNLQKDFSLSPVITENQGVIVTGVTSATSIRKSPVPVTTLRRQSLIQSTSTNIIDALSRLPGISQVSSGPAISKPVIRGLGYNRVVTINEGARQEGQQWGDEHGIEIDEMSVGRVEILKGPASLMYGSDALAGVINLITNVPVAEGILKGNVLMNYQTNNRLGAFHTNLAGNKNGFNWNVYGTYKSAGDYSNKFDGRVLNSRFSERNFGGYVGLNKSWGFSHLIISRFDQKPGMIEGDRDDMTGKFILYSGTPFERIATNSDLEERKPIIPYQHIVHYKVISDNSFVVGKGRLKVNAGFQDNLRKEFGNIEDPNERSLFFDLKTINYNIQWQLPEFREWHTTIGLNGMQQSSRNKGVEVLIPEYDLFDVGGFIYAQRFFKKFTLSGGVRFDNRSIDSREFIEGTDIKFTAFQKDFSNVSGSVGISYEPTSIFTMKANIARGFRSPTLAELGSNGAHEGTNRYEYGTRSLRSETSLQGDLGFDINYEHFNINIAGFYNRMNNFIFYRKLESVMGGDSTVNVDGEDITAFQFQQGNAKLAGVETSIDIHPHPLDWLHFENTFSFVRGKFDDVIDGSDNLPLIPAPRLISELRGNFNKAGKNLRNIYTRIEIDKTFDQRKPFTGYGTETMTHGYALLNAGAGADVVRGDKVLFSVHLGILNITDKSYQNHMSRLKYTDRNDVTGRMGVFNMGRNFSIKINVPISGKL